MASQSWPENVTWNTAPAADPNALATVGKAVLNTWMSFNVLSLITGDGTYSVRLSSMSTNGVDYVSREGSSLLRPQLVVTTAAADTTPPAVSITAPASGSTVADTTVPERITLSWNASTDDVAVANYAIFRGDAYIGTDDVTHLHRSSHRLGAALHLHGLCLQHGVQPVRDVCISDRHGALSTTSTFASEADASIIQASPSTNYGSLARIQTDGSPVKNFLIRFTVTGVGTSPVTGATLRLTCLDPSPRGGDLSLASSNVWAESTVTWNTAPAAGSTVSSLGPVVSRSTYGFDVSSLVHADGTYTFRATSPSTDGAEYASKEGALETRPQLIVTTAG